MHRDESVGCHGHDDEGCVYVAVRPDVMDARFHLRQISDQLYCDAKDICQPNHTTTTAAATTTATTLRQLRTISGDARTTPRRVPQ